MEDHIVQSDDNEYEVMVHPAWASRATIGPKGGKGRELYRQSGVHVLNGKGIPAEHAIRLKAKDGSKREISIMLNDPSHTVARITVELYDAGHDPMKGTPNKGTPVVFEVENLAKLCPPNCNEI